MTNALSTMRSRIRPTSATVRNSLSRAMSSIASEHILPGRQWNYRILNVVKGDNTHASTVFKAEVFPHKNVHGAPRWAIIKAASPDDAYSGLSLDREIWSYRLPGVYSAACFRQLYDVIDKSTIALEWLDTTLAEVKYQPDMRTFVLIKTFLNAALDSCVILADQKCVNTVYPAGDRIKVQPFAMRAPEVYLGKACTEPSQVWAVAAMLVCWIKPSILGVQDSPHFLLNEPWCIAKIKRLFPSWEIPTADEVEGDILKATVTCSRRISRREEPPMQAILPFAEEMQKVDMPQQLRDLLGLMFVINPDKRPSASSILASREFRGFEEFVEV
ncbi:uncharacterized protein K460DRAFT_398954 [Cucurbitaria berberidis CBS 394.84]|uniref:Protein kinase domain-containing protein n=1 Tax=Cucurbitaria berberidis CBS 394.84 TaxID=1168544 RepID=A0A9P4G8Q5_9PLEO|nr:uncharacterized protein K460DRAFT_398954 [Cucurbitaria berberidis CBS 394.84]KAF1841096.1 hypothetical protein K460DRAFT_398954 [Cucurbitaria berberidis CBS 394.84]